MSDASMDADTLKALRDSIAKWESIVAGTGEDRGADNCALCKKFANNRVNGWCHGCPVMRATGQRNCDETPYYDYRNGPEEERQDAAQRMLGFLKALLPSEGRS